MVGKTEAVAAFCVSVMSMFCDLLKFGKTYENFVWILRTGPMGKVHLPHLENFVNYFLLFF